MKYYCKDCGSYFDDLKKVSENRGECHGFPATETYDVCPCCGSDDWEEEKTCKATGEPMNEEDTTNEYSAYAHEILSDALKEVQTTLKIDKDMIEELITEHFDW